MTSLTSPSRGDQTRDALIRAALEVFGRSGFDAASTRAIAAAAGVNQALIGYHFGGKQGLYLGVFEYILEQMQLHMAPVADEVMARLAAAPDREQERRELAVQLLLCLFDAFNDMVVAHTEQGWVRLMLREQQDPTDAFQLLYDNMLARMLGLITHLVALATGLDEAAEDCRIRALMIFGQVLVFHTARATRSRHLGWETLGPDNMVALKEQVRLVLETQLAPGVTP
jgi:AcrR family transcriptional regulator